MKDFTRRTALIKLITNGRRRGEGDQNKKEVIKLITNRSKKKQIRIMTKEVITKRGKEK